MSIITKITVGFVAQEFDENGKCIGQEFVCGDDCTYENEAGEVIDAPANEQYQTYDMVQPGEPE